MLRKTAFAFVVLTLMLGMSSAAFAQKTTVLRVVIIKTDDVSAYLQQLEKGKEIMKKLGITQQIRVWQATFAGPNAGSVVAAIEYPSMAAFADADAKTRADKDYQAWLKDTGKIRTIVSDSLYREL
jgi:ABC-type sugar transport system substrate-binding protein